jgi:spore coat protein U-like protein
MKRIFASIAMVALCLASAGTSRATQVTQSMNVSLTIGASGGQVTLLVGSLVLTGPPAGSSGGATGTAAIHVTASTGLPYVITLNEGLHRTSGGLRNIVAATGSLSYALAADPTGTQLWGNGDSVLGPGVSGNGTGGDQAYTVYAGTAPYGGSGTPPPNGTYTDVVTVAVNF